MLEHTPKRVGEALRGFGPGLDKLTINGDSKDAPRTVTVSSPAFADGAPIPADYTADGRKVSPPLAWRGVPAGTAEIVMVIEDADSPTPAPLVHAILVGLPGRDGELVEGELKSPGVPGTPPSARQELVPQGRVSAARPADGARPAPLCRAGLRARQAAGARRRAGPRRAGLGPEGSRGRHGAAHRHLREGVKATPAPRRDVAPQRDPWSTDRGGPVRRADLSRGPSASGSASARSRRDRRPNAMVRMRRPHVYERSAPRRRREDGIMPGADPADAARSIARAMPSLIALAESASLGTLAGLIDAARAEAERIENEAGKA